MDTLKSNMNKLAKLFNAETGEKFTQGCHGKYAGYKDYFVKFNNENKFYIGLGAKNFQNKVNELVTLYENFNNKKADILNRLKEMSIKDNEHARFMNLKEYEILNIDYVKQGNRNMGWFYVTLNVDGKIINLLTTNFDLAIKFYCLQDIYRIGTDKNYYVAGGLKNEEVDFIFDSVGFNSENGMYQIDIAQ